MKKLLTASALALVLLALAACGSGGEPAEEENTQIANPWVECANLEEAAELAGFDIAVPDRIEGYPNTLIQAIEGSTIQVFYYDQDPAAGDASNVLIRKGVGTEDISGDYNEYPENETASIHGVDVTLRGSEGKIFTETWTQDGYAYSVHADEGMDRAQAEALVELVK